MTPPLQARHGPLAPALLLLALAPLSPETLAAGQQAASPSSATELPPSPLAIDGVEVPWTEFSAWIVLLQGRYNADSFVFDWLLEREAAAAGIVVDLPALERKIEGEIELRVQNTFGGDRSRWIEELERNDQSVQTFRGDRLMEELRQARIDGLVQRGRVVGADEVRATWEDRYGIGGRRMRMSRLFLEVSPPEQPPGTTRDENIAAGEKAKREVLERAESLHARLRAGADFSAMALELSDDQATREAGGRMREPLEPKAWPGLDPELLRELEIGQVAQPFYSRGGYNLLRLDSVETTPLESVALEIERELAEAPAGLVERKVLQAELTQNARVELLPELDRELELDLARLERPVALIDGQPVTRREFSRWLIHERGRPLARTFMQHRFVARRAREAGFEPTSVEIEQRVQSDLERQIELFFQGNREDWLADLAAKNQPLEDFLHVARQRTRHNLRAERLLLSERVVTPDTVHAAWVDRYGEGGNSLDVRYIVRYLPQPAEGELKTDEEAQAYVERESRAAMDFLARLRARVRNGEDFDALARTYSEESESRDRGGRPLERFELHEWPESLQAELRALELGGVAAPAKFGSTFFLFEVAGRKHVPFEEVEAELNEELKTRRPSQVEIASYVNGVTTAKVVTILPGMAE